MRKRQVVFLVIFLMALLIVAIPSFSAPPDAQTAGGLTRQEKEIQKKRALEQKIETPKPLPQEVTPEQELPATIGPKVLIKTINVEGYTLLKAEEVAKIIRPFENKELSLEEIQNIADLIANEYRKKGYVTSRVFIPPQTIKDGVVTIRVVEGKLGKLDIKGNRYFKSRLLERKINLRPAGYFDFSALQKSLININEQPDIKVKATLVPGATPGTTDIVLDVKDRLPFHAGFEYDNYGSRYINKNRYSMILEHNNLLGFDDKAYLKFREAEAGRLHLQQGRYVVPVTATLDIGVYFLNSVSELGREFRPLDSRGKARVYGIFLNKEMVREKNWDLQLNAGFDYKNIVNFLSGSKNSRDNVRVLKGGFDLDASDKWGRTLVSPEVDFGIPNIMGGMRDKDSFSSRTGAGGQFTKAIFNIFRLQPMPFSSSLLWKNSAQVSNNTLVASEEFQIGGPVSVRGYPVAEYSGDSGFYTSPEWSFPIYFLPKNWDVPFTKEKMYDTNRFVLFYDLANVHLNKVAAVGDKKDYTLRGWGFGWRFNLKENLSFRIEVGYPLGGPTPSDGDQAHPWFEFTIKF